MKTICLYFEIHQNIHLKRYRFFDIGTDHYYYDDYENENSINNTVEHSYIPALQTLLQMIKDNPGFFKVAFSISGCAIELLENFAPSVIELLQELSETGCVEFFGRTIFTRAFFFGQRGLFQGGEPADGPQGEGIVRARTEGVPQLFVDLFR